MQKLHRARRHRRIGNICRRTPRFAQSTGSDIVFKETSLSSNDSHSGPSLSVIASASKDTDNTRQIGELRSSVYAGGLAGQLLKLDANNIILGCNAETCGAGSGFSPEITTNSPLTVNIRLGSLNVELDATDIMHIPAVILGGLSGELNGATFVELEPVVVGNFTMDLNAPRLNANLYAGGLLGRASNTDLSGLSVVGGQMRLVLTSTDTTSAVDYRSKSAIGGLVGSFVASSAATGPSTISESFAKLSSLSLTTNLQDNCGNVEVCHNIMAGGLVGELVGTAGASTQEARIEKSYAHTVVHNDNVPITFAPARLPAKSQVGIGGLVGRMGPASAIDQAYAYIEPHDNYSFEVDSSGTLNGSVAIGGLVGRVDGLLLDGVADEDRALQATIKNTFAYMQGANIDSAYFPRTNNTNDREGISIGAWIGLAEGYDLELGAEGYGYAPFGGTAATSKEESLVIRGTNYFNDGGVDLSADDGADGIGKWVLERANLRVDEEGATTGREDMSFFQSENQELSCRGMTNTNRDYTNRDYDDGMLCRAAVVDGASLEQGFVQGKSAVYLKNDSGDPSLNEVTLGWNPYYWGRMNLSDEFPCLRIEGTANCGETGERGVPGNPYVIVRASTDVPEEDECAADYTVSSRIDKKAMSQLNATF